MLKLVIHTQYKENYAAHDEVMNMGFLNHTGNSKVVLFM